MLPFFLIVLQLLSSTHGLQFSHFPVTSGQADIIEDPPEHVRPTGRPEVARGGVGDALLALLASGDFSTEGYESVDVKGTFTGKVSRDKSRHSDSLKRPEGSVDENAQTEESENSKHRDVNLSSKRKGSTLTIEIPSRSRHSSISSIHDSPKRSENRQKLVLSRNIHARKKTKKENSMIKKNHQQKSGRRQNQT